MTLLHHKSERHFYLLLEYCGGTRTTNAPQIHHHKSEQHFYLLLEYCGGSDVQHLIRLLPSFASFRNSICKRIIRLRIFVSRLPILGCLKIANFGFARHLQSASLAESFVDLHKELKMLPCPLLSKSRRCLQVLLQPIMMIL